MALFDEAFVAEISRTIAQHYRALGEALGKSPGEATRAEVDLQSPLRRDLELLMQVANGELQRMKTTRATVQSIEAALQRLMMLLFGNAMHTHVNIPDDFCPTNTGILVSRVRWWLSVDDLITISNAAALAFGENSQANRMRIARAMEKGLLEWIPDPSVSNPQQNRRVLRSQVERLREQMRLPE
jgi:hypothetical protein